MIDILNIKEMDIFDAVRDSNSILLEKLLAQCIYPNIYTCSRTPLLILAV